MMNLSRLWSVFQVLVGILFLVIGGMDINDDKKVRTAEILNDVITILVQLNFSTCKSDLISYFKSFDELSYVKIVHKIVTLV